MTKYSERSRREFVSVLELIVLAFVIGIPVAAPLMPARAVTNHVVYMNDFYFSPKFTIVAPGDTVTWHNNASAEHTATSNTSAWSAVTLLGGQTSAAITMPSTAGTYDYICTIHFPYYPTMWGAIIVSNSVPEFSSSLIVVVGLLVMAVGLMLVRRKL